MRFGFDLIIIYPAPWFQPRTALIFFHVSMKGGRLDQCGCDQDPDNILLNLISREGERDFFSLPSEKKEHVACVFLNMSLYMFGHMPITLEFELLMAVKGVSDKWISN